MKRIGASLTAILLALTLTACGGEAKQSEAAEIEQSQSTPKTTEPEPETDTDTDTPEQVASVIAQYAPIWKETLANAVHCAAVSRTPVDATGLSEAMTCRSEEELLITEAEIASQELGKLTPPADMQTLVDETIAELDKVKEMTLGTDCAGQTSMDGVSPECSKAVIDFSMNTSGLELILNKWSPYL